MLKCQQMLHSVIISANQEEKAFLKAKEEARKLLITNPDLEKNPDFFLITDLRTIKINQIRELKQAFSLKPYQEKYKVALIKNAHLLTQEAQNALLKTLEEPPPKCFLFLTTNNKEALLSTILSRCQIIELREKSPDQRTEEVSQNHQEVKDLAEKIIKTGVAGRLKLATSLAYNNQEATQFCLNQLAFFRRQMRQKPDRNLVFLNQQFFQAINLLKVNVNPQLVVGNLLLSYPKSLKIEPTGRQGKTS